MMEWMPQGLWFEVCLKFFRVHDGWCCYDHGWIFGVGRA